MGSVVMARRTDFTAEEKHKVAQREVEWRLRVYPHRVAIKKMSRQEAEYQIDVMRAIAKDYRELERATEQLPLTPQPLKGAAG
jgi:hypothetical protein